MNGESSDPKKSRATIELAQSVTAEVNEALDAALLSLNAGRAAGFDPNLAAALQSDPESRRRFESALRDLKEETEALRARRQRHVAACLELEAEAERLLRLGESDLLDVVKAHNTFVRHVEAEDAELAELDALIVAAKQVLGRDAMPPTNANDVPR